MQVDLCPLPEQYLYGMNVAERVLVIKCHLSLSRSLSVLGMEKLGFDKCPLSNPPPSLLTAGLHQGAGEARVLAPSCRALSGDPAPAWIP